MTGVAHEDMEIFENHEAAIGRCESLNKMQGMPREEECPKRLGLQR